MAICKQETIFQPLSYTFPPRSSSPWTTTSTPSSETRSSSSRSSAMSWALLSALSLLRLFPFASPSCSFKRKKKKRSTASHLFLLRLCGWRGTSLPITASQGRALTPPSMCMDTKCANEELRRRRVMLKCFCPLAAIINITVVIDVYLQLANEDSNVHTCFKKMYPI